MVDEGTLTPSTCMKSFNRRGSLPQFQEFIGEIYGPSSDRLYSIWDLLAHQQRFAMRALKGIRKGDGEKLKRNLLVSLSWLMAIGNRLHVNAEEEAWWRFPMLCSYCGKRPCACRKMKPTMRANIARDDSLRPANLADFQRMFAEIYPPQSRTLVDAGIHLAEEIGEINEAVCCFLGEHKPLQFEGVKSEIADCLSCVFGVANSAGIDVAGELEEMYRVNCHLCHATPCGCNFSFLAKFQS